VKACRRMGSCR